MLFLQFFSRFFTQLRSIRGTIQEHEEVLRGVGARLGWALRESGYCKRD